VEKLTVTSFELKKKNEELRDELSMAVVHELHRASASNTVLKSYQWRAHREDTFGI
jgi:hypothetical protein